MSPKDEDAKCATQALRCLSPGSRALDVNRACVQCGDSSLVTTLWQL